MRASLILFAIFLSSYECIAANNVINASKLLKEFDSITKLPKCQGKFGLEAFQELVDRILKKPIKGDVQTWFNILAADEGVISYDNLIWFCRVMGHKMGDSCFQMSDYPEANGDALDKLFTGSSFVKEGTISHSSLGIFLATALQEKITWPEVTILYQLLQNELGLIDQYTAIEFCKDNKDLLRPVYREQ